MLTLVIIEYYIYDPLNKKKYTFILLCYERPKFSEYQQTVFFLTTEKHFVKQIENMFLT